MATTSPLRRRMIEDMTIRNLSQGDAAILYPCGQNIQPPFWKIAGPARY